MTELSAYRFSALRDGPVSLSRGVADGVAPILLATVAGDDPAPLEHEFALRAELDADWAAKPLALLQRESRQALVLEDLGGQPLDRLLGRPLDIAAFLDIAVPLAAALGRVHARGLIHKDIKPANILVDAATGQVRLTGFGIASRVPRERLPPAPPEVIAGTLAYMAPEQTGRMNRSIDSRSDLYALGVTFYEMLTGTLPFTAADPMEWVHCHIARQPLPPNERVPTVPAPISAIIAKLLAKMGEERYQTAAGLAFDLRRCRAEWDGSGRIDSFPLGTQDVPDHLVISERLYGREREIDVLLSAFEGVVGDGAPRLVLVTGYSGVGKSSLVSELHKALVPSRGLFASGKFDQYKRDIPYATLAQAFQTLVRSLLGNSEAELERWRDALHEALGANAQIIVNLVPELELVLGPQPPVVDVPPQEAKTRFQMLLRRFVAVFARAGHPLVLFVDDLQWLDAATLDFLEHLLTHHGVRHLLFVGAYRDNEVSHSHPLIRTLREIGAAGVRVHEIVLAPLRRADLDRFMSAVLHNDIERVRPLAQLVHEKTGGNPFFAIQFLTTLADEGLLAFDPLAAAWQWDMDCIRAKSFTDNIVELMAEKLMRLSPVAQQALKYVACLENIADLTTLTWVQGTTEEEMHEALSEAVQAGIVFHRDNSYVFLHDRIQQAAYSLIPDAFRADVHLHIGRTLLAVMPSDQLDEHLFDVANQLNRGASLLLDPAEKARVATIGLRAGRKAKASAAYSSAAAYFAAAMSLLRDDDWQRQYELTFSLWLERAESEFANRQFDVAEQMIAELLKRATSDIDQAAAYQIKVLLHTVKSESAQAVASALACLRRFGIDLPAHPTFEQVEAEYDAFWQTLNARPIESLLDLPTMVDPELQAAMQLLSVVGPPAYFTDFHSFCLIACRMAQLALRHGVSDASALGFAILGFISGPVFHRYRDAPRLTALARGLVDKHRFIVNQPKIYHASGTVAFWTQPVDTAIDFMRATTRVALETGDLTFACYGMHQLVPGLLLRNDALDAVWRESQTALQVAIDARYDDTADIIRSQQRFVATMQGRTASLSSFSDSEFDESAFETQLSEQRMPLTICFYWILKLKSLFLSGDYGEALAAAAMAKPLLLIATAQIELLDYFFYLALTVAAQYESVSAGEQEAWRELLSAHAEQLREWANTYPPTFHDKDALVTAEIARLDGRDVDAMRAYEDAIQSARQHGFVQNEALACELAGRFYEGRGIGEVARLYSRDARDAYRRWGAVGKVLQLEGLHPELREPHRNAPSTASLSTSLAGLDVGAVVKASHSISSEIVLARLVETLMTVALENAGAERGVLILLRGGTPRIEAEAGVDGKTVRVRLRTDFVAPNDLPLSLLHSVLRTHEIVILDDASTPNPFSGDAYFRERPTRSVLCLPLMKQATLIGALYLENSLASRVFTPSRATVLTLLSTQAAISLENARLFEEVLAENHDRRRAEDALRDAQAELAHAARLTTLGELAASIAHEINQPLTAIVSNGGAGLRWLNRATPNVDEARDAFARIVSDGQRAADVIRGLRSLAKNAETQRAPLDMNQVIRDVLALAQTDVLRHGALLTTRLMLDDRPVIGDRVQLQQLVLNLLLNAIEAMTPIADGAREVIISSALTKDDKVLVSIEDSGPGVDPAIAERIFQPFVTTKPEGLGLGLSICRSIVRAHGGQLWISPRAPHGCVLQFTIPVAT